MSATTQKAFATCLLAVLAVGAVRAAGLVVDPLEPRAARERRYFLFAWREPRVAAIFGEVGGKLRPGEPIVVAVAGRNIDHLGFWRGMALYWLPAEHRVSGVRAFGLGARDLWLRGAWPVRRAPEVPANAATLLCHKNGIEVRRDVVE